MEEQKKTIFLTDDNATYLNIGKTALEHLYTVVTIPSGEKLLLLMKKNIPDLILLDVEMPGMNGYEIIKAIKSDPNSAEIPVIFMTGKGDIEDEHYGFLLGAADYITKPFSQSLLLKRVELHIALQSQRDELRALKANPQRGGNNNA